MAHMLNQHRKKRKLRLVCVEIEDAWPRLIFHGEWRTEAKGEVLGKAKADFRIENEKIVEAWTRRDIYVPVFGNYIKTNAGLFFLFCRLATWTIIKRFVGVN